MRVFLDTNVVIAAFAAEGSSRAIFRHALRGAIDAVVSEQVLVETARNLAKLRAVPAPDRRLVIAVVRETCEVVKTPRHARRVCRDADDDSILAAALASEVDLLVTGDEDLLVLSAKIARLPIVTPAQLLRRIEHP